MHCHVCKFIQFREESEAVELASIYIILSMNRALKYSHGLFAART